MRNAVLGIQSPYKAGPDPDFPYIHENVYFPFPNPKKWDDNIIAVGGNLSPGMLLSAYEQGIFPWYNPGDPVIWQSPDPRCVIFPGKLHISSSMRKIIDSGTFTIKYDNDFIGVIRGCSEIFRPGQGEDESAGDSKKSLTWISDDIIEAYAELHRLGWAHSAEAWQDGKLAGGCYGILLGRVFMGESMFAKKSNASKAAFLNLAEKLFKGGLAFIDCQVPTRHLLSLGGEEITRKNFLKLLKMYCGSRN